jgi:hypothetical protein
MRAMPQALIDLEAQVYEAMTLARDQGDHTTAQWLFKVWVTLPAPRPHPIRLVSDRAGYRRAG